MIRFSPAIVLLVALLVPTIPAAAPLEAPRSWTFSVHLDDAPIGYHRFELQPAGDGLEVLSEARFDVKFLFFNAFQYRHVNRESWDGRCLARIESETRENDREFAVSGERVDDRFVLQSAGRAEALDSCVMTFAYWDPAFLQQSRLLNPQSGEYVPVDVEPLGRQEVEVRGGKVLASAWRVTARDTQLTVWYSEDNEWLGLESVARGGRIIRYVLT
jgi:hypothetical protein